MLNHGTATALVIDDDHACVQALRPLLEAVGYHVSVAQDPDEGLAILRASRQDLLVLFHLDLTGYTMSGLDSAVVLGALLKDDSLARHACIAITESADAVSYVFGRLLACLAVPILAKPFDAATVRTALAAVLDRHGRQRMLDSVPA